MRLPFLILGLIILAFMAPEIRHRWQLFRHSRLLAAARAGLRRDAFASTLYCVDPETDAELDLHVEGGEFGVFCVNGEESGFALLMMIATSQHFYPLTDISPFEKGERSRLRDQSGSPLVALPPILNEGEIRFGCSGRLFYALTARSREPLDLLVRAEKLAGIPLEALEGIPLARLPGSRRST